MMKPAKAAKRPEPRSEEEYLDQCRRLEVKPYGHEGLVPVRPEECYHGADGCCISSSGNSICGGYEGHYDEDGKIWVTCGEDSPEGV